MMKTLIIGTKTGLISAFYFTEDQKGFEEPEPTKNLKTAKGAEVVKK
jgi:hypothetical protein